MRSLLAIFLARTWAHTLYLFLRRLGGLGLFLMGILDSSFLVMPFSNDFLIIAMVSTKHGNWVFYAIMAALGSTVGCLLVDVVMRKGGEEGLTRLVQPEKIEQLRKKLERKAWLLIWTAALMPPPFPFTPVVMTAAALQYPRNKLLVEIFGGRLLRFTIEALLAIYFGRKVLRYLRSDIIEYLVYALLVIAVVGSAISIVTWVRSRHKAPARRPREVVD